jgi:uncharacterized oxidoreductase
MKTTNNTILITGGGSGIGFEMAKLFSKNNKVIITGQNAEKLSLAATQIENTIAFVSDVNSENDVNNLVQKLNKDFPDLNIVINSAGLAHYFKLTDENANAFDKASAEIMTNYLSIVRLTEKLLPLLQRQEHAAFVNISSITAFSPGISAPSYSVSKAALHSYTQVLRATLGKSSKIKVFEVMPPLVNTGFSEEIGGNNGISPSEVAQNLMDSLLNDKYEIRVGQTEEFYQLYLSSPEKALEVMNSTI